MLLTELGVGWSPAFAADTIEREFIKEQQRISADQKSFWIGGLGEESLESQGYSEGKPEKNKLTVLCIEKNELRKFAQFWMLKARDYESVFLPSWASNH